ncbi:MAG: hypothetical protein ACRDL6_04635, partial [Solirubrobacterales bacterium]
MEGRRPPDEDPFEWTDSPPRSGRRYSERSFDTGESETPDTEERSSFDPGTEEPPSFDPGSEEEGAAFDPGPGPEDPYESWREGTEERQGTGEPFFDSSEWEALDTGEREALDTGEREAYET